MPLRPLTVGAAVGVVVGALVGVPVGTLVGVPAGVLVAALVGAPVGVPVGAALGARVGVAGQGGAQTLRCQGIVTGDKRLHFDSPGGFVHDAEWAQNPSGEPYVA